MSTPKRIGVFGGAFDPPHNAHIALARCAIDQFDLHELRVIPTGNAWHKARTLSPAPHRLAMTRLAFAELPQAVVDPRELEHQGPTYTFDTLQTLKVLQPLAELYLFIGADQADTFTRWHRWRDVWRLARVVVAERPLVGSAAGAGGLAGPVEADGASRQWHNALPPDVQRLDMPSLDVSATEIRAHYARGVHPSTALSTCLPVAVQHYIEKHRLYRA